MKGYCKNIHCQVSEKIAKAIHQKGFENGFCPVCAEAKKAAESWVAKSRAEVKAAKDSDRDLRFKLFGR